MVRFWALILGAATAALEEPYPYLHGGNWTGDASSFVDPMRAYAWTTRNRSFQVFFDAPVAITCDPEALCAAGFDSLARAGGAVAPSAGAFARGRGTVPAAGGFMRFEFAQNAAAWIEVDVEGLDANVTLGVSEHALVAPASSGVAARRGKTLRLELTAELYDGLRYAWLRAPPQRRNWTITAVRRVTQVVPSVLWR